MFYFNHLDYINLELSLNTQGDLRLSFGFKLLYYMRLFLNILEEKQVLNIKLF